MRTITNSFTQYALTKDEELLGKILSTNNLAVMQNRLSNLAMAKIALTIDSSNPHSSLQQEAELQGQILLLQQIINESNDAATELASKE